jgi:hypothetical protein
VLLETAVLAETVTVIGCVDDQRVGVKVKLSQFAQQTASIVIEILNGRVIGGDDASLIGSGEIAEDDRDLRAVLGTRLGHAESTGRVFVGVLGGKIERRMRF